MNAQWATKTSEVRLFQIVKILIGLMIVLLNTTGLATYGYQFGRNKFAQSRLLLVYSVVVVVAFTLVYGHQIYNEYTENLLDIQNADKLYSYLNIFTAFVSFIASYIVSRQTTKFLNQTQLFETLAFFSVDERMLMSSILIISIKAIAFPIALELTVLIRQKRKDPERNILWTLYTFIPWIVANAIPNCFFGGLMVSKRLTIILNNALNDIAKEVNCMQTKLQMQLQKSYYRMQRFCDLADKLDRLAQKYALIGDQTLVFVDLLAPSFLCSLLINLFGITAGLFAHYNAIADSLINEDTYDGFNALTNSVFLVISILEIALQAQLSNDSLSVVKETGHILQRMNLLHADVRFKQSVEAFSLLVLVKKYKIQPFGLLEINVSLLHDVLSAVASFLLILIQSDLALRFSLK